MNISQNCKAVPPKMPTNAESSRVNPKNKRWNQVTESVMIRMYGVIYLYPQIKENQMMIQMYGVNFQLQEENKGE